MKPDLLETAMRSTAAQAIGSMRARCYNDTAIIDALTGPRAQVCASLIYNAIQSHLEAHCGKPEKEAHAWAGRKRRKAAV